MSSIATQIDSEWCTRGIVRIAVLVEQLAAACLEQPVDGADVSGKRAEPARDEQSLPSIWRQPHNGRLVVRLLVGIDALPECFASCAIGHNQPAIKRVERDLGLGIAVSLTSVGGAMTPFFAPGSTRGGPPGAPTIGERRAPLQ
jgi:hypothetical protein